MKSVYFALLRTNTKITDIRNVVAVKSTQR